MSEFAYRKPDLAEQRNEPSRGKRGKGSRNKGSSQSHHQEPEATAAKANPFSKILLSSIPPENTEDTENLYSVTGSGEEKADDETKPNLKKKEKFINMYQVHEGNLEILLPGRHSCQCMCTKHRLIRNCLSCGRIVCEQEGSGPCFTCGNIVGTEAEIQILQHGGLEAEKLKRKMFGSDQLTLDFRSMISLEPGSSDSLRKAEAHRDTLLEYDRTAAQRTRIIDDQMDYYSEHAFMSKEEREAVRKREAELRSVRFQSALDKKQKMSLDFAGREVAFRKEESGPDAMYSVPAENEPLRVSQNSLPKSATVTGDAGNRQTVSYDKSVEQFPDAALSRTARNVPFRVQDRGLLEMVDTGATLSVRQPWASFIVMGLKPHEGRDWYTAHRGKLWIASGTKLPPPGDIVEEENLVKALLGDEFIVFPEQYLTGFLLGSVDVVDCITQEEYQKRYPGGLLNYPYILMLENPVELEQKFPIEGKNKIFKMDLKLHQFAKAQAQIWPKTVYKSQRAADAGEIDGF